MNLTLGSRGSLLALAQAKWVQKELNQNGFSVQIKIIKTKGDVVQDRFDKMEGKGFFTKEIEDALLEGDIDLAVHSLKDLPTSSPTGLTIQAYPTREDCHDVLISMNHTGPSENTLNIGTSSLRRVESLRPFFPKAVFQPIRGNVPTRIQKMELGQADIVVLAKAGLNRLNIDLTKYHIWQPNLDDVVPAPGQGSLAIQTRDDNKFDIRFLNHEITQRCVEAERKVLASLGGGCQTPFGIHIRPEKTDFKVSLFYFKEKSLYFQAKKPSPEQCAEEALKALE